MNGLLVILFRFSNFAVPTDYLSQLYNSHGKCPQLQLGWGQSFVTTNSSISYDANINQF